MTAGTTPALQDGGRQKAVIHAGFRKAGSTTIQDTLGLNEQILRPTHYVCNRGEVSRPVRKAVLKCSKRNTWLNQLALSSAIKQMARRLKDVSAGRTIIVSNENLFGAFAYLDNGDTLIDWAVSILPKIEKALIANDIEPHFVLYTRPFHAWCRSAWAQAVTQKKFGGSLEDFVQGMPENFSWETEIRRIEAVLQSKVQHVDLPTESATSPFLGYAVLEAAGVTQDVLDQIEIVEPRNISARAGLLEFLQVVNSASEKGQIKVSQISALAREHAHYFVESIPE